jgi:mediator of RNA polymerase II transcription subunit 31
MSSEDPSAAQPATEVMDVAGEETPIKKEAVQDQPTKPSQQAAKLLQDLPKNRFELELEFVQSLASPAYLHYLATNPSSDDHNWLDDPEFVEYLRYLFKVWTRPEYNRFLVYPQALYFLEWMLNHRREEWAQVAFRNFAHQQQFLGWQHRATRLYGRGSTIIPGQAPQAPGSQPQDGSTLGPQTGMEVGGDAMKEG